MNLAKTIVEPLYTALRVLFFPLMLLFRPIGMRPESVVAVSTLAVVIFVVQPIAAARLGGGVLDRNDGDRGKCRLCISCVGQGVRAEPPVGSRAAIRLVWTAR